MDNKGLKSYEITKLKILNAVASILKREGYQGLYIRNIAREAGVLPKLIYYHFGTVDNLVETYIRKKDYWLSFSQRMKTEMAKDHPDDLQSLLSALLHAHYELFEKDKEMQKLILWELSEYTELLRKECDIRENFGNGIFEKVVPVFKDTDIDIQSVTALFTAGIYYMILHAQTNGSRFCGRDINLPEDKKRLLDTINKILAMCFEAARKKSPSEPR